MRCIYYGPLQVRWCGPVCFATWRQGVEKETNRQGEGGMGIWGNYQVDPAHNLSIFYGVLSFCFFVNMRTWFMLTCSYLNMSFEISQSFLTKRYNFRTSIKILWKDTWKQRVLITMFHAEIPFLFIDNFLVCFVRILPTKTSLAHKESLSNKCCLAVSNMQQKENFKAVYGTGLNAMCVKRAHLSCLSSHFFIDSVSFFTLARQYWCSWLMW